MEGDRNQMFRETDFARKGADILGKKFHMEWGQGSDALGDIYNIEGTAVRLIWDIFHTEGRGRLFWGTDFTRREGQGSVFWVRFCTEVVTLHVFRDVFHTDVAGSDVLGDRCVTWRVGRYFGGHISYGGRQGQIFGG